MNVQIAITGFSNVTEPATVEALRVAVAQFVAAAETVGYPLRVLVTPEESGQAGAPAPTVTGLDPSAAVCGAADLILKVYGSGFTASSVILFNQGEEATTYVSATELQTGVKPSLVSAPLTVPVSVVGAAESFPFTFTAAPPPPPPPSRAARG